jgi:hypothetical protein
VARAWCGAEDSEVAAHIADCSRCAAVRTAAEQLRAAYTRDLQAARVPPAAAMWWRLERRRAAEHAQRVQRLTSALQALVLAAAAGVAVAAAQIASPWLPLPGAFATDAWQVLRGALAGWPAAAPAWMLPVAVVVGAWVLLVPAALYVGLADE